MILGMVLGCEKYNYWLRKKYGIKSTATNQKNTYDAAAPANLWLSCLLSHYA